MISQMHLHACGHCSIIYSILYSILYNIQDVDVSYLSVNGRMYNEVIVHMFQCFYLYVGVNTYTHTDTHTTDCSSHTLEYSPPIKKWNLTIKCNILSEINLHTFIISLLCRMQKINTQNRKQLIHTKQINNLTVDKLGMWVRGEGLCQNDRVEKYKMPGIDIVLGYEIMS